jgi:hypothetical protein
LLSRKRPIRSAIVETTQSLTQLALAGTGGEKAAGGIADTFGGLVSPDLVNAFATNRTKSNMNPPTTVPYVTEARP